MNEKNRSSLAKWLIIGGGCGFAVSRLLALAFVAQVYDAAGSCLGGGGRCPDNFDAEQLGSKLSSVLGLVSIAAVLAGAVILMSPWFREELSALLKRTKHLDKK